MMKRRLRIYPDTSVFGGLFDDEFRVPSVTFWDAVAGGAFDVVVSALTEAELRRAPERVRAMVARVPRDWLVTVRESAEADELGRAYVLRGVVPERMWNDALHVALATIAGAQVVVSWNFRHMVNVTRIRSYQAVNLEMGYPTIDIRTPKEVVYDE